MTEIKLIEQLTSSSFGFDISSMSAIVITNQYVDYFDNPHGLIQGAIGSALAGGSVIGSLAAGPISDKWGRRNSIWFACFWWILGTAVQGMLFPGVSPFLNPSTCIRRAEPTNP
jgi:MFS family permease